MQFQDDVMNALETIAGGFRIFHEKLFLNQSGASIHHYQRVLLARGRLVSGLVRAVTQLPLGARDENGSSELAVEGRQGTLCA